MMTDRELVARAILGTNLSGPWNGGISQDDHSFKQADAVLAALGDRLMPELPENWWSIELYKSLDGTVSRWDDDPPIPAGHVYADMWDDAEGPILSGTGPTPAAAIRAALEQP